MATKRKWIDDLPEVTLPMTGNESLLVSQAGVPKRVKASDIPANMQGYVKLDGSTPFQHDQSMSEHRLTDLGEPAADADAVRFADLKNRTGWVKVVPLETVPEVWEADSLYLIRSGATIIAYLTDSNNNPANLQGATVVSKINDTTGSVTVGLSFAGGKLKIALGNNADVDLDARYLQITDYDAPDSIPNVIEEDKSGDAAGQIADDTTMYVINPDAIVTTMTRTLPKEPEDYQTVSIHFGGEIANGEVVTKFIIDCDAEHTIVGDTIEDLAMEVGDCLAYQFHNEKWYRR